jgi:hypothetical protein
VFLVSVVVRQNDVPGRAESNRELVDSARFSAHPFSQLAYRLGRACASRALELRHEDCV